MFNRSSKMGWVISIIIIIIFGIVIANDTNKTNSTTNKTYFSSKITTTTSVPKSITPKTNTQTITWHCIDATSYNKNPYDDNMCTSNAGEVRYVSDSQARALDPSYTPGTYGHPYYNSK